MSPSCTTPDRRSYERFPLRTHATRVCLCAGAFALAACGSDTRVLSQPLAPIVPLPKPDTTTVLAGLVGAAELPRIYLNTTAPVAPAIGRVVIPVAAGGNFQAALNSAQQGDVIELAAGATFTGNFNLPAKVGTGWITIRPSNWASLPAPGVRMTPSVAAALALPKLQTPNSSHALAAVSGAHHYRIIGLDISTAPAATVVYATVDLGSGVLVLANVPHDLVLDRLYIHGTTTGTVRRCVALNSASTAIIDSWLSDCHEKGSDSQAIAGWSGPGPFKIVNNYLEGAGENIMFGGSDPAITDVSPSDIEIRRNHITKPLAWTDNRWTVKNLFELKHAVRVLVEGNVFENTWAHAQDGTAILIKSVNQNFKCTWCVTRDVTFRYNVIRNVGGVFNVAGSPDNVRPAGTPCPCIPAHKIVIHDNLITNINVAPFVGSGRGFATYGDASQIFISHNTLLWPTNMSFVFGPAGTTQLEFTAIDNLVGGGTYGLAGDNIGGAGALARYTPGGVFQGNVMVLANGSTGFPVGNFYPATAAAVGFTDIAVQDFRLLASSPYKGKATDGKDPGANIDGVTAAVSGVRVAP